MHLWKHAVLTIETYVDLLHISTVCTYRSMRYWLLRHIYIYCMHLWKHAVLTIETYVYLLHISTVCTYRSMRYWLLRHIYIYCMHLWKHAVLTIETYVYLLHISTVCTYGSMRYWLLRHIYIYCMHLWKHAVLRHLNPMSCWHFVYSGPVPPMKNTKTRGVNGIFWQFLEIFLSVYHVCECPLIRGTTHCMYNNIIVSGNYMKYTVDLCNYNSLALFAGTQECLYKGSTTVTVLTHDLNHLL